MLLTALAGLLWVLPSLAAGGHHAVDDASILDPGQCHIEAWAELAGDHRLQHLGPACRALGMEIGLDLDRSSVEDEPALRSAGLRLKWAQALQPGLSWGLAWAAAWQNGSGRSGGSQGYAGQSLVLPVSWAPREDVAIHLNVGRDFNKGVPDQARYGAAIEWRPLEPWQGLFEQWSNGPQWHDRLGLRHFISESISVDLSRAQTHGKAQGAWWTLGLNWAFAR